MADPALEQAIAFATNLRNATFVVDAEGNLVYSTRRRPS